MIYCIWWTNSTIISWCLLMTMLPDVGVNIQLFGIQKVPKLSAPSRFAKLAFPLNKRRFVYIAIKIYYLSICIINSIYQELYVYIYILFIFVYIYIHESLTFNDICWQLHCDASFCEPRFSAKPPKLCLRRRLFFCRFWMLFFQTNLFVWRLL